MRRLEPALLYGGLGSAAIGFALIAFTWGRVAALEAVALQLPYLVSGGLTGLGLIIVGATAVNIAAKRREGVERERQAQQLAEILRQATAAVGGTPLPSAVDGEGTTGIEDDGIATSGEPASDDHTEELMWRS